LTQNAKGLTPSASIRWLFEALIMSAEPHVGRRDLAQASRGLSI